MLLQAPVGDILLPSPTVTDMTGNSRSSPKASNPKDPLRPFVNGLAKFWILLIGIDEYKDQRLDGLKYAVNDCLGMEKALLLITNSFQDSVKMFTHCTGRLEPSKTKIMSSLQSITQEAEKDDIVLIYFSGHGYSDPNHSQKQTYLCLPNTELSSLENESLALSHLFQNLTKCSAKKQLVLIDACNSGDSQSVHSGEQTTLANELLGAFDQHKRKVTDREFYAFLSCAHNQKSYEDSRLKHGIFTYFLIRGLEGEAADNSHLIRSLRLFDYVQQQTASYAEVQRTETQQTPKLITDATESFAIGIAQSFYSDNPELTRQERTQEYEQIYIKIRQKGVPLEDRDRNYLNQELKRLRLVSEYKARQIEDDVNHLFSHCEADIFQHIETQSLPICETSEPEILSLCRRELGLQSENISYVYQRIIKEFNQKLEQYLEQVKSHLETHGLENGTIPPLPLPDGLLEGNVAQARHDLIEDYKQRLANKVTQYRARVSSDLDRYDPIRLEHEAAWESLALKLDLDEQQVKAIEAECRKEYASKKLAYESEAKTVIRQGGQSIGVDALIEQLQPRQSFWGLRDEVAIDICKAQLQDYLDRCDQYTQIYSSHVKECYPIPGELREDLLQTQHSLELHEKDVLSIETGINQQQEENLKQYRLGLPDLVYTLYPVDESTVEVVLEPELVKLQRSLDLGDRTVHPIQQEVISNYRAVVAEYRQATQEYLMIKRKKLQDTDVVEALKLKREFLRDEAVQAIHTEVEQDVRQRREREDNEWRTGLF